MFIVMFEFVVKEGYEAQFLEAWPRTTQGIYVFKGSLGSRLHRDANGRFIAYAQWPDEATYRAAADITMSEDYESARAHMHAMLPQSGKDYALFVLVVSVSAGICEELIFRWYLYGVINEHFHWSVALVLSSIAFGLWHAYLGWQYIIKTMLVGALLCGVFLYVESLLVVIVLHILLDVYAGTLAYAVQRYTKAPCIDVASEHHS